MRFWIPPDAERRADPAPAQVDVRIPVVVGIVLWAVALVLALALGPAIWPESAGLLAWTPVAGLGVGAVLLGYALRRR